MSGKHYRGSANTVLLPLLLANCVVLPINELQYRDLRRVECFRWCGIITDSQRTTLSNPCPRHVILDNLGHTCLDHAACIPALCRCLTESQLPRIVLFVIPRTFLSSYSLSSILDPRIPRDGTSTSATRGIRHYPLIHLPCVLLSSSEFTNRLVSFSNFSATL